MNLTPAMRKALRHLRDRPDAPISHRNRPGDISANTAAALERAGLAVRFCVARDGLGPDQVLTGPPGKEWVTDPGRLTLTTEGRRIAQLPEPEQPVFMTTGGALRYRTLPPSKPGAKGRVVVDDGIPAEHRGYSTARAYESDQGHLDAHGLTIVKHLSAPGDTERQDPDDLHPEWRREAEDRRIDAAASMPHAARLARLIAKRIRRAA
jgi:hypothetical protein